MKRSFIRFLFAATALGCSNAGADLGFGVSQTAGLDVKVFFDRDNSDDASPADTSVSGLRVRLFQQGVQAPADSDTTNATGDVHFRGLSPGYYLVTVDSGRLGDSVVAVRSPAVDTVRAGGTVSRAQIGLAPRVVTLAGARAMTATSGPGLSPTVVL